MVAATAIRELIDAMNYCNGSESLTSIIPFLPRHFSCYDVTNYFTRGQVVLSWMKSRVFEVGAMVLNVVTALFESCSHCVLSTVFEFAR